MKLAINLKKISLIVLLMSLGAFLGVFLKIPLGALMGSFLIIAVAQIIGLNAKKLNKKTVYTIQMIIGGSAGLNINSEIVNVMKTLFLPGIMVTMAHLLISFLLAFMMLRMFKIDIVTALLGTIPAGMSEVVLIANEKKSDVQLVVLMHLFRVSIIVTFLPLLIFSLFLK
jgi:membrane AbrB-like protein